MLSLIPQMGIGGAEAVAATLALHSRGLGHSVQLASGGGFRAQDLVAEGVPHLDVPLASRRPLDLARSVRTLRKAVRAERPQLVHAHNVKAALVARLAVGRRVPVLATLHGVPAHELAAAARILRRAADRVVAVSPYVQEQLVAHGYPADRISIVENSITPLPRHPRTVARRRLGLCDDSPVVVCLARMVDQKRHDLLVRAWVGVREDAVLLLAGDGPNRTAVEAQIAELALTDRVQVLGARTDADWLLAAADVAVLPTDWEGLPISLLEAMGAGVPVVVSRVGGVVETLGEGVRLVEPGSPGALTEGLEELLGNAPLRATMGRRGQELVARLYGPNLMLDAYDDLFAELAGDEQHGLVR